MKDSPHQTARNLRPLKAQPHSGPRSFTSRTAKTALPPPLHHPRLPKGLFAQSIQTIPHYIEPLHLVRIAAGIGKTKNQLGFRLSLDHLAGETLGAKKTADGLQALRWWKEGRLREIIDYCRADVEITRDLYRFGRDQGYLLFRNKAGQRVRAPVRW